MRVWYGRSILNRAIRWAWYSRGTSIEESETCVTTSISLLLYMSDVQATWWCSRAPLPLLLHESRRAHDMILGRPFHHDYCVVSRECCTRNIPDLRLQGPPPLHDWFVFPVLIPAHIHCTLSGIECCCGYSSLIQTLENNKTSILCSQTTKPSLWMIRNTWLHV